MNKNLQRILLFTLVVFLVLIIDIYQCPFRLLYGIPCVGCGMSAAFWHLLNFEFIQATYDNLFAIPFAIVVLFSCYLLVTDYFKASHKFSNFVTYLRKPSSLMIITILFMITWIFNIYKYYN